MKFKELEWLPIGRNVVERTVDLHKVRNGTLLRTLKDGQLNVLIRDDTWVDYARLDVSLSRISVRPPHYLNLEEAGKYVESLKSKDSILDWNITEVAGEMPELSDLESEEKDEIIRERYEELEAVKKTMLLSNLSSMRSKDVDENVHSNEQIDHEDGSPAERE